MAYALNTSHPLYANLIELIGVQAGALVSHKTARTFTKHAEASYGTGPWGEHFTSVNGGYTVKGASFSPALDVNTSTTTNYTVFIVFNARTTSGGGAGYLAKDTSAYSLCSPNFTGANKVAVYQGYTARHTGAVTVGSGNQSVAITRAGDNAANGLKLYEDGGFDNSSTTEYGNATAGINYIGGYTGQGAVGASVVWIAVFSKALSAAEILDLHNSIGADNAFGLVETAGGSSHQVTGSNSQQVNSASAGSVSVASGTLTIPAVKDWGTGNLKAGETGVTVIVNNATTGALVVKKTGQTTHATTGVCTVMDPLITPATNYRITTIFADGSEGTWRYTAT